MPPFEKTRKFSQKKSKLKSVKERKFQNKKGATKLTNEQEGNQNGKKYTFFAFASHVSRVHDQNNTSISVLVPVSMFLSSASQSFINLVPDCQHRPN